MTRENDRAADACAPVEVTFDLGRNGWGKLSFQLGSNRFEMSGISYTTDALGDLVRLALAIAVGGHVAECSFDLEPAEWRVVATRTDARMLDVKVYLLEDIAAEAPLSAAVQYFVGQCLADDWASAVERAATEVVDLSGHAYQEAWQHEFPSRALAALRTALALPPPRLAWGPPAELPTWE